MSLSTGDAELIRLAIESRLGDVYTALPGRIESYDAATQTADVAPTVRRAVPTGPEGAPKLEDIPVIPNVPILFPRGGAFSVTWPLEKGNHVVLIFMTYALAQWRKTGKTADPGDLRLHHVNNAVAIPILAPNGQAVPEAQASANSFTIVGPLITLGAADATDFAALASKVDANFNKVLAALNSAKDSTNATLTYGSPFSPDPVACERVKIK